MRTVIAAGLSANTNMRRLADIKTYVQTYRDIHANVQTDTDVTIRVPLRMYWSGCSGRSGFIYLCISMVTV